MLKNTKTLFSASENTERKARKALEKKLKMRSKKSYAVGEIAVIRTCDNKYMAYVEICNK